MTTALIAIGVGIAVFTGVGAGIGMGIATSRLQKQSQDSRKPAARLIRCCSSVLLLQRLRQYTVSLLLYL